MDSSVRKRRKEAKNVSTFQRGGDAYRRFQSEYGLGCSYATFLGLCAYLFALIRWGYVIPASAYDEFLCSHSTFIFTPCTELLMQPAGEITAHQAYLPAYHVWFQEKLLSNFRQGDIIDSGLLCEIATEHPYTFMITEASMDLIARKASKLWSIRT